MKYRQLFFIIFILFFSFVSLPSFAYDSKTTHPKLTDLTVDYFNQVFPNRKLSSQEKNWLIQGAIEEDKGIRSINHFYDPVYNRTYQFLGVEHLLPELTAKEWSQDPFTQALYDPSYLASAGLITESPVFSQSNFTWQKAIYEYAKGNKEQAFIALGHILHLIQDMTVPEHTRANVHIYFLSNASSAYELFSARPDDAFYQDLKNKIQKQNFVVLKPSLNDYFDNTANYSNNYFYSPDTIGISKYSKPEVAFSSVPEIENNQINYYVLGYDENGQMFHLAERIALTWRPVAGFTNYTLKSEKVLNDYWQRLPEKAIFNGAGVIDLFFKQAERAKLDPNFISQNENNVFLALVNGLKGLISGITQTNNNVLITSSNDPDSSSQTILPVNNDSENNAPSSGQKATGSVSSPTTSTTRVVTTKPSTTTTKPSPTTTTTKNFPTTTTTKKTTTTTKKTVTSTTTTIPVAKQCFFEGQYQKVTSPSVIINEVAWMGSLIDANNEWIELKNISSSEVDLAGWHLLDEKEQIKVIFPKGTKIKPNGFLLLERSDSAVPFISADFIYSGALSNTNEGLRLFNSNCLLQDEVLADPNWPAGDNTSKRTMERTQNILWQTYSEEGEQGIFGTPKKENSQPPLTTPTTIVNATSPINNSDTNNSSNSPTPTTTKPVFKILINEIKVSGKDENGKEKPYDEFIELYNPNNFEVNLTGYYLQKKTSGSEDYSSLVPARYLENKIIPANGYLVITHSSSTNSNFSDVLISDYSVTDNNTIVFKGPDQEIIDQVGYGLAGDCEGSCALSPNAGQSIQRRQLDGVFIDTDNNLNDFELQNCPSPKGQIISCFDDFISEDLQNSEDDSNNEENSNSEENSSFPLKNIHWRPLDEAGSKIILEFDIDKYPFVENGEFTSNIYFGLIFFLNQQNQENIPGYLEEANSWQVNNLETLNFLYPNCQSVNYSFGGLYFTAGKENCHSIGMPRGRSFSWNQLPKNNHFVIEIKGTNLDSQKNFTKDDFINIGIYSFVPKSNSALRLVQFNNEKLYFEEDNYTKTPARITDFEVTGNNSSITFNWQRADQNDNNLNYEIHYVYSKPGDTLENNDLTRNSWYWSGVQSLNSGYQYLQPSEKYQLSISPNQLQNFSPEFCEPLTIYFAIKAKNNYDLYSEISPIKAITLQPQLQNFSKISDFLENVSWHFNSQGEILVEFDLIKRNVCLGSNFNRLVVKAGWDYEPGLIFFSSRADPWNDKQNRSGGRLQNSDSDRLLLDKYPPALGHYTIKVESLYHPLINSGNSIKGITRQIFQEKLEEKGKTFEDVYLILAFGASDQNYYNWFFYNSEEFNQPQQFPLTQ
ncbi:MAG TPA: lamin tail domain-containing protein [Candidatus Paceibacterota bacterium]|nr:lamin tail domain-containing protein [Candidatus Paceibacterota bacterium]